MKKLFLILCLCFSLPVFAALSILSDFDDTIKISASNGNYADILRDKTFFGMTEFFKGSKTYANELHVLSASPELLRSKIKATLKRGRIEYNSLNLRARLREKKLPYKIRVMKEILEKTSDDFILIGDDLGEDPEAYLEIKEQFPSRVRAIYIHVVSARVLPPGVVPYWTSFDLFLREYMANRMTPGWVEFAVKKFQRQENLITVFPRKANCPVTPTVWEWQIQSFYQPEAAELMEKFVAFCQQRQSDNILL